MPNVNILRQKQRPTVSHSYCVRYVNGENKERKIHVMCRWAKEAMDLVGGMKDCVKVLRPVKRGFC